MEDQRAFTDYRPSCELNRILQDKFKVQNSHEYRYYLQKNAEQIMKDFSDSAKHADCKFCPICSKALEYKPTGQI